MSDIVWVWNFEEKSENIFINKLNMKSFLNVNMEKGDIIFIPRKHWHKVRMIFLLLCLKLI